MYRSPAGPPADAGVALARHPQPRARLRRPAGYALPLCPGARLRPSPRQVGQTFFSRPVPSQRWQRRLNFIAPAICVTVPVPSHSGHTATFPPAEPVPWQVSHISWR